MDYHVVTQLVPFHQQRDSHVRDKSVEKGKQNVEESQYEVCYE